MRLLVALLALLGACGRPDCVLLPRAPYEFVLVNRDPESFFCWTQDHPLDLTDDASLAASFAEGCQVTVDRQCGAATMKVLCPGVNLSCYFDGAVGECANDLDVITCHYDAWLDRRTP